MTVSDTIPFAELLPIIRAADPGRAETMERNPTTFGYEPLPFYAGAGLVAAYVMHRFLIKTYL